MIKETVVKYGRYGVLPSQWYEEPIRYIIDCMGWDTLDERGERFKDFVRLLSKIRLYLAFRLFLCRVKSEHSTTERI